MRKLYKIIIANLVAITLSFGSANAFEGSGLSVGIYGTNATFNAIGTETEYSDLPTGSKKTRGTNAHDVDYPAIFVEYSGGEVGGFTGTWGVEYIPGKATIGNKSRAEDDTHSSLDDDGTYVGKAKVQNHTTLYVEPGYTFNENVTLYGKLGVNYMEVLTLESLAFGSDSSTYGDADVYGATYGGGVKLNTSSGLFVKVEQTFTEYSQITLTSPTGNKNTIHANLDSESTRLAIGFNF